MAKIFWFLPAGALLVAFAGLCVMTGTAWPWNHVVHEEGTRTLLATVFYVEHAARELVPDTLLALAVAGAVRYYFPVTSHDALRWRGRLGWLVAAMLVGIVGGTLWAEDGRTLIDNLSQSHTRAGAPLVWGAHWRYHLIERFAQMMLAFSASGVIWTLRGKPDARQVQGRFRLYGVALALFAAVTLVFGLTSEPFRDPAYLGHQLRELFTHTLVTLPLALGVCLALARTHSAEDTGGSNEGSWPIILTGSAAALSGTFLFVASLLSDAQSHGQATGLAGLLWPHFAEHALGYVLVPALAGVIYLTHSKTRSAGP